MDLYQGADVQEPIGHEALLEQFRMPCPYLNDLNSHLLVCFLLPVQVRL